MATIKEMAEKCIPYPCPMWYAGDDEGALEQFVNYGIREGRQASEGFDVRAYRAYNEDLREEFQGNFTQYVEHYLISGINEHRRTTIG